VSEAKCRCTRADTKPLATQYSFNRKNLLSQGDLSALGAKDAGTAEKADARITKRFRPTARSHRMLAALRLGAGQRRWAANTHHLIG
jgi:hypothetical protein